MKDQTELVAGLIALNGGEIVGKTRLQKTVYILDACGLSSGFEFDYGNFGPFSADLAQATDDAELAEEIKTVEKPGYHEVPYTVFKTSSDVPDVLGELPTDRVLEYLGILKKYSAIILELAATIHYFFEMVDRAKINAAVQQRKPLKATVTRMKSAWELLEGLKLTPS